MSKDTGGPAFPTVLIGKPEGGMTLRDYFAAKAMQAMLTTSEGQQWDNIQLAEESYKLADAMLKERK